MAKDESTAITELIHLMSARPLAPIVRDSEPTLVVHRMAPMPPLLQSQPQEAQLSAFVVMTTALIIGVLGGICVVFV